jgi:hypothetical protein
MVNHQAMVPMVNYQAMVPMVNYRAVVPPRQQPAFHHWMLHRPAMKQQS